MVFSTTARLVSVGALCALLAACGGGSNSAGPLPQAAYANNNVATGPSLATMSTTSTTTTATTTTSVMSGTSGKIGLFQVFDAFGSNVISSTAAVSDGPRYGVVWGARAGMPTPWKSNNTTLAPTYYMPMETDASTVIWGEIGHSLTWWKTYHPDWILYTCTSTGTPTTTPAYVPGLPYNVPLDIHNPSVVNYQVHLAAKYAIAYAYSGLGFDEVLFTNITGESVGSGYYGCGIYQNGSFVRRYSGRTDPAWTADTVAWVKAARSILTTDTTLSSYHLRLVVNHPAGNVANTNEQAILQNVDADLDETGYSDYGNYKQASKAGLFKVTTDWMNYAQAHGAAPLIVDKFDQTTAVTSNQLEYSIATYLMGHDGGAGLFVGNQYGYGAEQYHSEYTAAIGTACGAYYGGASYDSSNPQIWYRKFSGALIVVNSGSLPLASETAHLPTTHTYKDLEGRAVTNPLTVASNDAYVLLTTNGCQ